MIRAFPVHEPQTRARQEKLVSLGVAIFLAILSLQAFTELSPRWAGVAVIGLFSAGALVAQHSVRPWLRRRRALEPDVLVLGREDLAARLCAELEAPRDGTSTAADAGLLLDPDRLLRLVQAQHIRRIIVAEPDSDARRRIADALLECRALGVEVQDASELYQRLHGKLWLEALDPTRLAFSRGFRITPAYLVLKRVLDVVCAIVLLALAWPVMALIAIAIRLESKGPVLFRQERVGQFGRPFTLLKFRSMRQDAERDTGPTWARPNDDRVTRIGRFLRKSHLDEIPQAINVLRGDLSFVGPRPERPCFVSMLEKKIRYYHLRHFVKPGITGWAQVCYPYADSIEDSYEKLQYDLAYIRDVSLWLDLRILVRTSLTVVTGRGQ